MLLIFTLLLAMAAGENINQTTLEMIFGKLPADYQMSTEASSPVTSDDGTSKCRCVPYYLCNDYQHLTLSYEIFESQQCSASVEICCRNVAKVNNMKVVPSADNLKACGYRFPAGMGYKRLHDQGFESSQFGEFPWMVALLESSNDRYIGSGAIIHPQVIIAVAHYAYKYSKEPSKLKIRAGEWDLTSTTEIYAHQERELQDITIHHQFSNKTLINDIALIRLKQPLQLLLHINTICLPEEGATFSRSVDCVISGWPRNIYGGSAAVVMNKHDVNVYPPSTCSYQLKRTRLGPRFKLHDSFMCYCGENVNVCQIGGGAPLSCSIGEEDRYVLAGLGAWAIGCNMREVPGVSVDVSTFRTWVDSTMDSWGYDNATYTYSADFIYN